MLSHIPENGYNAEQLCVRMCSMKCELLRCDNHLHCLRMCVMECMTSGLYVDEARAPLTRDTFERAHVHRHTHKPVFERGPLNSSLNIEFESCNMHQFYAVFLLEFNEFPMCSA